MKSHFSFCAYKKFPTPFIGNTHSVVFILPLTLSMFLPKIFIDNLPELGFMGALFSLKYWLAAFILLMIVHFCIQPYKMRTRLDFIVTHEGIYDNDLATVTFFIPLGMIEKVTKKKADGKIFVEIKTKDKQTMERLQPFYKDFDASFFGKTYSTQNKLKCIGSSRKASILYKKLTNAIKLDKDRIRQDYSVIKLGDISLFKFLFKRMFIDAMIYCIILTVVVNSFNLWPILNLFS